MIAALATSLCALAIAVSSSNPARAETCLAAPKSAASAGSHWYYHLDRATQHKCWHLVADARKGGARQDRSAALRAESQPQPAAQPQGEGDAPPVTAPMMKDVVQRLTQPFDAAPSQLSASSTNRGNAFAPAPAVTDAPPIQTADPATTPAVASDPPVRAADAPARNDAAPADAAETAMAIAPPAPSPAREAVASKLNAATPDAANMRMLPFAIGAFAASLLAAALVYASARRREQTIVRIVDLNTREPSRWSARDIADAPLAATAFLREDENRAADLRPARPSRRRAA